MKRWIVLVLLGVSPCLVLAGNSIEEANRAVAASGLAAQQDDSDLDKVRAYASGDFDGRNKKIITKDNRLKEKLSSDISLTDQTGKTVHVQVGAAPAVSDAEDVSSGVSNTRATSGQSTPATTQKGAYSTQRGLLQNAAGKVVQNARSAQSSSSNRNAQPAQTKQDSQNQATAPVSGRQGGGVYFPNRPGQGGLGSKVPLPSSNTTTSQSVRPSARQSVQVTTQQETATLSGGQGEGASEAQKIMAATQLPADSTIKVSRKVSEMSEEDRHKFYSCLRAQSRAKKARAAGITIDIGACENMDLDKIKVVRRGEISQEEIDARADELAAQALRNAQQTQKSSPVQQTQAKSKAQQAQKASLQKKAAKVKKQQLKKANKECASYTYDDICTECCASYGSFSGNIEAGHCRCR